MKRAAVSDAVGAAEGKRAKDDGKDEAVSMRLAAREATVAYLAKASRDHAITAPELSRSCARRLLEVLYQECEAADVTSLLEVVRFVCPVCCSYRAPPHNTKVHFANGPLPENISGNVVDTRDDDTAAAVGYECTRCATSFFLTYDGCDAPPSEVTTLETEKGREVHEAPTPPESHHKQSQNTGTAKPAPKQQPSPPKKQQSQQHPPPKKQSPPPKQPGKHGAGQPPQKKGERGPSVPQQGSEKQQKGGPQSLRSQMKGRRAKGGGQQPGKPAPKPSGASFTSFLEGL
eukprot:Sspe_Gene.42146::Locus_20450_Transcript_5_5_Confidence_0.400_Length_1112::g.42146::m.42146